MHFSELFPHFDLDFLSSIKHFTAKCWHTHVVLLFKLCLLHFVILDSWSMLSLHGFAVLYIFSGSSDKDQT